MICRHIVDTTNTLLSSTLVDKKCLQCIENNTNKGYGNILCELDGKNKRLGFIKNNNGCLYACSDDCKTTKVFKTEIESIASTIKVLKKLKEDIQKELEDKVAKDQRQRVDRVIHNLKSINGHCIQELYNLVPQDLLTHSVKDSLPTIESIIIKNPHKAALLFTRIARLNMSTKAEFSVYEKLLKNEAKLQPRNINPRDLVMIVLYMFFGDFSEKNVYVDVGSYYEKAKFDFESVQVAVYHLVENSVKYVKPDTTINISFDNDSGYHVISFKMDSLHVYEDEREKIFNEGYSGENAVESGLSGKGIGMFRIKRLLELNKILFKCYFGDDIHKYNNFDYSINTFEMYIPC